MIQPITIRTRRLILRPWREEDLEFYALMNSDPRVMEYFPSTLSREESDRQARLMMNEIPQNGWGFWAVEVPDVAKFIGWIGLRKVGFSATFTPAVEIGWRVAFDHWGHGYATEGARACLQYGFEILKLKEIVSFTAFANQRSQRVMQQIGMHHSPADDFDHPKLSVDCNLRRHVLYRIKEDEWKRSFASCNVKIGDIYLHTESFGNSADPACILIAGKMSTARFWSDAFCQYLAKHGFFTIRTDHRDVGESSQIEWQKTPYSMSDLAKDAISILNCYGIKKAHFVGNSMGGWICQRIGVDYPERILSLVIISAGPIEITENDLMSLTPKEQEILDNTSKIFHSVKEGKTADETAQNFLPVWRHLNAEIPLDEEMAKKFTIDFLTRTKNKNAKNHDLMMQKFLSQMKRLNILQKIERPTLVIHGDKDPVVLPRHGKAVADAIPKSKLVMIKGVGHSFFNQALEEKIAKLVVDHIRKAGSMDNAF